MNLKQQWCENSQCSDYGRREAGNIQVFSRIADCYYCRTCGSTFSADKGTFFETLRSPHAVAAEVFNILMERNSLRAVERLNQRSPKRLLAWLELACAHDAAVSAELIQSLHQTHVQIDELWTFVNSRHTNTEGQPELRYAPT